MKWGKATILAFVVSGLLTVVSLRVAPSMYSDVGWGMLQWRTLEAGGTYNTFVGPDPADIFKDRAQFMPVWTPGQYMVPGVFMLAGANAGQAFSLTAGLCLLCGLLGWIRVLRRFGFSPELITTGVAFLALFRYSTVPFGIYNGGEVLLQGITPWVILAGCRVPYLGAFRAGALACAVVLISFFAKITGIIVAGAVLVAGSVAAFRRLRRITPGMAGAMVGSVVAGATLIVVYFSRVTGVTETIAWTLQPDEIVFSIGAAWGAGISWSDMMAWLLLNPNRRVFQGTAMVAWFPVPLLLGFGSIVYWGWKRRAEKRSEVTDLLVMTVCTYAVCASAIVMMKIRGLVISEEERHFRSAGTLIFVCVFGIVQSMPGKVRVGVLTLFALMASYGALSFAGRARSTKPENIDGYSGTHQVIADMGAIRFVQDAYAREGRDALFIVPSADVSVVFPAGARVLPISFDFQSEAMLAAQKYRGRVRGHLYVVLQTRFDGVEKGKLVREMFTGYPIDGWERRPFGETTVLFQRVSEEPGGAGHL